MEKLTKEQLAEISRENGKRGGRPTNFKLAEYALRNRGLDLMEMNQIWLDFHRGCPHATKYLRNSIRDYRKVVSQEKGKPVLFPQEPRNNPRKTQNKPKFNPEITW
ncbi:MAG: hypothetical protein FWC00_00795 [Firmicutes bacterium]|nr:hypothetical protein [Bacillota bacterium]